MFGQLLTGLTWQELAGEQGAGGMRGPTARKAAWLLGFSPEGGTSLPLVRQPPELGAHQTEIHFTLNKDTRFSHPINLNPMHRPSIQRIKSRKPLQACKRTLQLRTRSSAPGS